MTPESRRILREKQTLRAMAAMYCRGRHGRGESLCAACSEFLAYALKRLENCPFGAGKPTCANCAIHCYSPQRREQAAQIMRYAGPRMLWRHPILTLLHFLDRRRAAPT